VSFGEQQPWDEPQAQRPRSRWPLLLLLLLGLGLALFLIIRHFHRPEQQAPGVTASAGRLTAEKDDGKSLTVIDRRTGPEVWYRVTLENAPVGQRLKLVCDWIAPGGKVVHRNRYQTRAIDRATWPTHARYRFAPTAPTGTWTVRLSLDGRFLHELTFRVADAER
jgi:hypothetical protein